MRTLADLRNQKLTKERKQEIAAKGGKSAWKNLSPEEKSREMRRRRRKGQGLIAGLRYEDLIAASLFIAFALGCG